MLTLAMVLLLFSVVELVGGSGPMTVLTFGIILGNSHSFFRLSGVRELVFSEEMRRFQAEVSFLVRALFLVYIGMILNVSSIMDPTILTFSILILVAILAARFLAVSVALHKDPETKEDRSVLLLMMPRGLTAAVLALMPVYAPYNISAAQDFLAYAFLAIIFTNVLLTIGILFVEKGRKNENANKKINGKTNGGR
jgi:NhaP-type Na+/H+ or K+/H+ antiporter